MQTTVKPSHHQARSQEEGNCPPPNSESSTNNFQGYQAFDVQAKEMRQRKSTKLLEKPILLQLLVEHDQSSMVYQLHVINQTVCIVQMLKNSCHSWPLPEV